jgi:CRISPR-associated protein Cst2
VTQSYFHVKYAPEGRGTAAGGDTVSSQQAIFHRPTNSGIYALICGIDLYRIGLNDITRQYVINDDARRVRAKALIQALVATLIKPNGAQRSTQNPHILACTGLIATSMNSLPAPTVSPLHSKYRDEMQATANVLNSIRPGSIEVHRFESLSEGVKTLADLCESL